MRSGRESVDQVFILKQMIELMREKRDKLYIKFRQAFDRIKREDL